MGIFLSCVRPTAHLVILALFGILISGPVSGYCQGELPIPKIKGPISIPAPTATPTATPTPTPHFEVVEALTLNCHIDAGNSQSDFSDSVIIRNCGAGPFGQRYMVDCEDGEITLPAQGDRQLSVVGIINKGGAGEQTPIIEEISGTVRSISTGATIGSLKISSDTSWQRGIEMPYGSKMHLEAELAGGGLFTCDFFMGI